MTDCKPAFLTAFFKNQIRRYRELNLVIIGFSAAITVVFYTALYMHEPLVAIVLLVMTLMGMFSLAGQMESPSIRSISLGYELGAITLVVGALTFWSVEPVFS